MKMKIYDIWKIQRPLFASDGDLHTCLGYTQDRENTALITMTEDDMDQLFGDDIKAYVFGEVRNDRLMVKGFVTEEEAIGW